MSAHPRLEFAFTESDTPKLRDRIARDVSRVTERVASADRHLRALILTGGFSRGEGTVRADAPLNDYDLVAVRDAPGAGPYRALHQSLSRELGIEVDLAPVWSMRLPRVAPKLFWLDLRLGGKVIHGDALTLHRVPRFDPSDIPAREVARLLGNRAAGMLLALPAPGERADQAAADLQATKAVLAALDAHLLSRGRYAPTLRERLALTRDHPDHPIFARAVAWKLRPRADLPIDWWSDARDVLLRAVEETNAHAARDGLAEHALHLLRAKRVARSPSQAVRRRAWALLATSQWPEGPLGVAWGPQKRAFVAARARTLQ